MLTKILNTTNCSNCSSSLCYHNSLLFKNNFCSWLLSYCWQFVLDWNIYCTGTSLGYLVKFCNVTKLAQISIVKVCKCYQMKLSFLLFQFLNNNNGHKSFKNGHFKFNSTISIWELKFLWLFQLSAAKVMRGVKILFSLI